MNARKITLAISVTSRHSRSAVDGLQQAYSTAAAADKTLDKRVRKQLQIEHGPHLSREAKCVKLGDKICNIRDILASSPEWPLNRKHEYFDWASEVVNGLRGENIALEQLFDREIARKSELI